MKCGTCGSASVIMIEMQVADEQLTFTRCGSCENNVWESPAGELSLQHVLDLARTH